MTTSRSDVVDVIRLEPDAGVIKSLGAHHTFDSAIADLVDNALDAHATRISVRLLTEDDRLVQVEVVDNGDGMDGPSADKAMTLGHQREYTPTDLGHFGVGMKAASFSHSDVLTVWSSEEGSTPVGRRIRRADFSKDFSCERLSKTAATSAQRRRTKAVGSPWGTTIVWSELRSTYRGANVDEARTWMSKTELQLRTHLGVTFHRLLTNATLEMDIVVDEFEYADEAVGTPVRPIDPFGYRGSGHPGYPKTLIATSGDQSVLLHCHIWPAKTDIPGFRIQGQSGDRFQGFYVYRHDRLLQAGGWSGVVNQSAKRQLARVVIDEASAIGDLLTMNPEKAGLRFEPRFRDALARAKAADGTTFDQFIEDAESTYKTANKKTRKRHPVITPARGFSPQIRRTIQGELGFRRSESVEVRWKRMPRDEFFDIDFRNSTLLLNQRYRYLFAPNGGSMNDAPVVKALMFLLTHHIFEGTNLGPKDKDDLALWRSILGSAVATEEAMRG